MPLPIELTSLPQWLLWRYEERDGKRTKVPYRATGGRASTTQPDDWTTYEAAVAAEPDYDGIGFVFAGNGIVGIDLDNCLVDGKAKPWAAALLSRFANTYAEISPSGVGVKVWVRGKLPTERGHRKGWRDGAIEMYERGRFFTVTGNRYGSHPSSLADQQPQIDGLYRMVFGDSAAVVAAPPPVAVVNATDDKIIDLLTHEFGGKGRRLWDGDTGGYVSQSEADAGLVSKIAFYTGPDQSRIDRIFRRSRMYRPKWDSRRGGTTWGAITIGSMLARQTEFYDWTTKAHPLVPQDAPRIAPVPDQSNIRTVIDEILSGVRENIPWPWRWLTEVRALLPGTLTVLCGAGGSTKSMLMNEACLFWLSNNLPFAVFHLEEDREFHQHRALAQLAELSDLTDDAWMRANEDYTREALAKHGGTLDAFGRCIWDAPSSEINTDDLIDWTRDRAAEGRRVIIIDPITAAEQDAKPWINDHRFVIAAKTIMRDRRASMIVVTHPRGGTTRVGEHLDNMAGGRAYNRFTQAVLWLAAGESETVTCLDAQTALPYTTKVNRTVHVLKARSSKHNGVKLGYLFDSATLRFTECGQIVET